MKLPYSTPVPAGAERAAEAKRLRDIATEVSRLRPQAQTRGNAEEEDHGPAYPANFTKGLQHDADGVLENPADYRCFVEAINAPDETLFEKQVPNGDPARFACTDRNDETPSWRGWESPRAGHVYELEGPDPGAVGMAPAPRVGSSELAAEMAEVYGLALLRDVPFTTIVEGGDAQLCGEGCEAVLDADKIVHLINDMPFYSGVGVTSSTPHNAQNGYNQFEYNRRFARTQSIDGALTPANAFRGSTKGALAGPYISQFMLIGANSLAGGAGAASSYPGLDAAFDLQDGFIPYGSLVIDQRTITAKGCLDYMTDWASWLDVQNGADLRGNDQFEATRRFITTPRDLATYVHYDALYEAYLNACLVLLAMGAPASKGFPEPSPSGRRTAFATFGGPHILSLVTEIATRCLKAVRRQKFNYHRRARPEALGGRLTLSALGQGGALGPAEAAFEATLNEIPAALRAAIAEHNAIQKDKADHRLVKCPHLFPGAATPAQFADANLLLPMAFPEGSPMHPAYGAGHATVAGGCVTMLKAFFEMFEDADSFAERPLTAGGQAIAYVPSNDGAQLANTNQTLTIQGELDKLAANISIGRNMAGVHYYSDYYDSLRMGERIAVGMLLEQAPTYGETVDWRFKSYDGDLLTISGEAGSAPSLTVMDRDGVAVDPRDWWLAHTSGEEMVQDL